MPLTSSAAVAVATEAFTVAADVITSAGFTPCTDTAFVYLGRVHAFSKETDGGAFYGPVVSTVVDVETLAVVR